MRQHRRERHRRLRLSGPPFHRKRSRRENHGEKGEGREHVKQSGQTNLRSQKRPGEKTDHERGADGDAGDRVRLGADIRPSQIGQCGEGHRADGSGAL